MLRAPEFWQRKSGASLALMPAAMLYRLAGKLKNHFTTPVRAGVPVICIGNAVAGGAGKTPVALAVGQRLRAQGVNAFFLSRGYGGKEIGPVLVGDAHTSAEVGDEPLLLARVLPTLVSRDRVKGAEFAVSQGAEVIIMDDGFQNPSLYKDLSLLVVDGEYGFGNGALFPAGPLREPVGDALARADAMVVIDGDMQFAKPVLRAWLVPAENMLNGVRVLGFAGIGRPEKFRRTLEKIGCIVCDFIAFGDHHPYSEPDMQKLMQKTEALQAVPVTTAKDFVRVPATYRGAVKTVDVSLVFEDENALDTLLVQVLP